MTDTDSPLSKVGKRLKSGFLPPISALRAHRATVERDGEGAPLVVALEREHGRVSRHEIGVLPPAHDDFAASLHLLDRWVKFLLWSRGARRLHIGAAGPGARAAAELIAAAYAPEGTRSFDIELMERVYGRAFEVGVVEPTEVPDAKESTLAAGGNFDGCRIGIDLGASDYKLAAVIDGEPVFSTEIPWDPKHEADPAYHRRHIKGGLELAASHLPRVDAIGCSAAGIYIDDRVKVASLFRGIPAERFATDVEEMLVDIGRHWKVPFCVVNDGDVTALAGALALEAHGVLGIAMGSSEAGGYVDGAGHITGWLNELAFGPVDLALDAAVEEWSGDRGVGALYFSQQAVGRLADDAAIAPFAEAADGVVPLPQRLEQVQALADDGDPSAEAIFTTIGDYLGFTIPWYLEHYDFGHVLILGRVTSGRGGEILASRARRILADEFPEVNESVELHMPDEETRRVGQAVAAASLPTTDKIDGTTMNSTDGT